MSRAMGDQMALTSMMHLVALVPGCYILWKAAKARWQWSLGYDWWRVLLGDVTWHLDGAKG